MLGSSSNFLASFDLWEVRDSGTSLQFPDIYFVVRTARDHWFLVPEAHDEYFEYLKTRFRKEHVEYECRQATLSDALEMIRKRTLGPSLS